MNTLPREVDDGPVPDRTRLEGAEAAVLGARFRDAGKGSSTALGVFRTSAA